MWRRVLHDYNTMKKTKIETEFTGALECLELMIFIAINNCSLVSNKPQGITQIK